VRHPRIPPGVDDVPGLLRMLLAQDPGGPRVTWYGPGAERVELSAKVLDNWVAKTANLLVDELDVGPASTVLIDLPAHWRTAVWLLATWSAGACAVVPAPGSTTDAAPDVLVTTDPRGHVLAPTTRGVAVALPALAVRFPGDPGELPPDWIDAAVEVRGFGDVFVQPVAPAAGDPALVAAGCPAVPHAGLLTAAAEQAEALALPDGVRLLTCAGPAQAPATLLAPLLLGGSVVLHHDPAVVADGGTGPAADIRRQLVDQERITAVLPDEPVDDRR